MNLLWILIVTLSSAAWADLCREWSDPQQVGRLPIKSLNEASGVAASKAIPNRLYWINDSGDKGHIYLTQSNGEDLVRVNIENYKPQDTEALALTPCGENECLVLADIGDNKAKRPEIELAYIVEREKFPAKTPVKKRVKLKYPDGPHDAEAMAFLPNGDLLLVSKELRMLEFKANPAGVYTLEKAALEAAGRKPLTLKKLGVLPLPDLLPDEGMFGTVVTDMAISTRRNVLALLTYNHAIEIPLDRFKDLSKAASWKKDQDFSVVQIRNLNQQETIWYAPGADQLLWSTEYVPPESPIFSMTCNRASP